MVTAIVLFILAVALAGVLWAMFRIPSRTPTPPATVSAGALPNAAQPDVESDPWNARRGDVVSLRGAAEDYSDIDFPIDRRSAYEAKNHRWVDLSGTYRGRRVYLEVYRFPEPDLIAIVDPRKLTLSDLGVTEEQLAELDARQDPSAYIQFENKKWYYESSREIGYFENETGEGEGLYRWLFREENGPRLICIEKWEGEPFEVRIARRLDRNDITVYRAA